jgi:cobalt-zinc-cadmium efflux system outer membrane protein
MRISALVGAPRGSWQRPLVGVLLGLTLPLARTRAQTPTAAQPSVMPAALDLNTALALARRAGPLQRVAGAREQAGLGRVREGAQWLNPTIEWRRENLGSPLQPDIFATLYVPMDVSGRRLALRQAAAAGRQRVAGDATAERRDGELAVARAWLRAASAQGALDIAQRQFAALREIADVDAARLREGLVAEAVGLRTSLEADRARVALVAARSEAAQARAQLSRLLSVPDGELPPLAPLAAPALPAPPDSQAVRTLALRLRPDVQAREAAVLEGQRRLAAEQRGVFGEMQLQGGTKETGGFMTGQVGLAMPFPLFNRNGGARQRVAGELAEARALRDDLRLAVTGSVAAAWHTYVDVRAAAAEAATFDARGREVARIARVAYREGHATLTELLDAERAAADAMQAHLRWAAEAWLARLELERAIGARLDADGPLDLPVLSSLLTSGS